MRHQSTPACFEIKVTRRAGRRLPGVPLVYPLWLSDHARGESHDEKAGVRQAFLRRRVFATRCAGAGGGANLRVGGLTAGPRTAPYLIAVFEELRLAGFIEGTNLTLDWRTYGKNVYLIPEFVTELIKSRVDVIVVTGDLSIRTVQQATTTMPILGLTDDMVGSGLVKSLARPDGNTTGVSILAADLDGKRQ